MDRKEQVGPALQLLINSMQDPYVSIDLEWSSSAENQFRFTPVALIQLATATRFLLIRTSEMRRHKNDTM